MRRAGIYGCAAGAAAAACIAAIWGLWHIRTQRPYAGAEGTALEEEPSSLVEQVETGGRDWELVSLTQSFIEAAGDYVVDEYSYFDGDKPQREIVSIEEYEAPKAVPQTAVAVSGNTIDRMSMTHAVCAIEAFCGTDFCITDTYYAGSGAMVQFEHGSHEYTCMEDGIVSEMTICDAVFEMRATDGHMPDEIKIAEPDDGAIELREAARAFIQSAEDYVIYEYGEGNEFPQRGVVWLESLDGWSAEYPGSLPGPIVLSEKTNIDYITLNKALCAIEAFCGGTDFCIADTYYVGSGGNVQFEYEDHEYTCITESSVTDNMKICDAVFEVHSADGINITVPHVPDEIKIRDKGGAFRTLLTNQRRERAGMERKDANTVDVIFTEKTHGSADWAESREPETEQSMYKSPIPDETYVLMEIAQSFFKSVEDYVIYEYDYRGGVPQKEIVFMEDFENPEDIPQTAVVIAEESIDVISMERALCAIEAFCGGTDYRIVNKDFGGTGCRIADTCYVGTAAVVRFEHDSHEYTCIGEGIGGHVVICDAVLEVRSVDDVPKEIKITETDGNIIYRGSRLD